MINFNLDQCANCCLRVTGKLLTPDYLELSWTAGSYQRSHASLTLVHLPIAIEEAADSITPVGMQACMDCYTCTRQSAKNAWLDYRHVSMTALKAAVEHYFQIPRAMWPGGLRVLARAQERTDHRHAVAKELIAACLKVSLCLCATA